MRSLPLSAFSPHLSPRKDARRPSRRIGHRVCIVWGMALFPRLPKSLAFVALAAATAGISTPVHAADSRDIQGYEVRVPNVALSAGAARARVASAHDTIRGVVTDYAHYSQIITRF